MPIPLQSTIPGAVSFTVYYPPMTADEWRPTTSPAALKLRAEVLGAVRSFFAIRAVLEVETPLLSRGTVTDVHLEPLSTVIQSPGCSDRFFLQTSPEFAMKRLLAAGSGPIYQICKAFRNGEAGSRHNPEFTMLEWYRPGWDHHRLMDEVEELLVEVLGTPPAVRRTYAELFENELGVDVHGADAEVLRTRGIERGLDPIDSLDREGWLGLMMTHLLEPDLGRGAPLFLYDYPVDQAALARIRPGNPPVAERFEVYVDGVELANGYHELTDPEEQRRRFERDLDVRRRKGLPVPEIDPRFLAALEQGLPPCAGVALGLDRLVMLAAGAERLNEVLTFPIERA